MVIWGDLYEPLNTQGAHASLPLVYYMISIHFMNEMICYFYVYGSIDWKKLFIFVWHDAAN
jgi:hypothetical protein